MSTLFLFLEKDLSKKRKKKNLIAPHTGSLGGN